MCLLEIEKNRCKPHYTATHAYPQPALDLIRIVFSGFDGDGLKAFAGVRLSVMRTIKPYLL